MNASEDNQVCTQQSAVEIVGDTAAEVSPQILNCPPKSHLMDTPLYFTLPLMRQTSFPLDAQLPARWPRSFLLQPFLNGDDGTRRRILSFFCDREAAWCEENDIIAAMKVKADTVRRTLSDLTQLGYLQHMFVLGCAFYNLTPEAERRQEISLVMAAERR